MGCIGTYGVWGLEVMTFSACQLGPQVVQFPNAKGGRVGRACFADIAFGDNTQPIFHVYRQQANDEWTFPSSVDGHR